MALATVRVQGTLPIPVRKARLQAKGVGTITLPWWPSDVENGGLAPNYSTQNRPGRLPLLLRDSLSLPTIRMSFTLGTSPKVNIDDKIVILRRLANRPVPVTVKLGRRLKPGYRITELSIVETDWTAAGSVSIADIDLTLTMMSDATAPIGPVKGTK